MTLKTLSADNDTVLSWLASRDRAPSTQQVADRFRTGYRTAQMMLDSLRDAGLIYQRSGRWHPVEPKPNGSR